MYKYLGLIILIISTEFLPHYRETAEATDVAKSFRKRIAVDLQFRHLHVKQKHLTSITLSDSVMII